MHMDSSRPLPWLIRACQMRSIAYNGLFKLNGNQGFQNYPEEVNEWEVGVVERVGER